MQSAIFYFYCGLTQEMKKSKKKKKLHDTLTRTIELHGLKIPSAANIRVHWAKRAAAAKKLRVVGRAVGKNLCEVNERAGGMVVTFVRVAPRLLDDDNLAFAFKAMRDGVADALGVSDGPSGGVTWRYEQRRGEVCVEVCVDVNWS